LHAHCADACAHARTAKTTKTTKTTETAHSTTHRQPGEERSVIVATPVVTPIECRTAPVAIARSGEHACRHSTCSNGDLPQLLEPIGCLRHLCCECTKLCMLASDDRLYL
jgi:hypothetical protein